MPVRDGPMTTGGGNSLAETRPAVVRQPLRRLGKWRGGSMLQRDLTPVHGQPFLIYSYCQVDYPDGASGTSPLENWT
jgi:hypothetical protein